ncbi:TPA: hypothetical protein N0F65_003924 [Lagenidium giganteum]|uniref:J domain-containing protein n=1 Tax=Lagenidium giganteum TaxID=4803 RepID=A0AAV2ZAW4_9STRA|nr:TPA: hypothetical protein N0F65_003924 [Lagenidium giganteum]
MTLNSDLFSSFFYQICVVTPALGWILQPGRFSRTKGFTIAVAFLVALAAVQIRMEFAEQESNFYHVIGVPRDSSLSDIKKAYRTRSVDLHPDKNTAPDAVEQFNRLRLAFDVLGDADKRSLYDLFGEDAVAKERVVLQVETIIGTLSFYAVWAVTTYILTLSEAARDARAWSYAGEILFLVLEVNLKFSGAHLPPNLFPYMTIHEFTKIVRMAFPPFMNGCRAIGGYFYRNIAQENFKISIELLKSNQAVLLALRQLQGEVASSRRRPESTKTIKAESAPPGARKRLKMEKHNVPAEGAAAPVAEGHVLTEEEKALYNPTPVVQAPPSTGIPSFVYVIGFYLIANYMMG